MIDEKINTKEELIPHISKLGFAWDVRISQYGLIKGINYYRIYFTSILFNNITNPNIDLTTLAHSKFDEGGNLKRAKDVRGMDNIIKFLNKEFKYDMRKNKIDKLLKC